MLPNARFTNTRITHSRASYRPTSIINTARNNTPPTTLKTLLAAEPPAALAGITPGPFAAHDLDAVTPGSHSVHAVRAGDCVPRAARRRPASYARPNGY